MANNSRQNRCPFVSVIIPVYNDSERLFELLGSLDCQSYGRENYEIIVVDNGSDEDPKQIADKFDVRLLYEKDIQSSYAARNKGIGLARGEDIYAFIDSDCKACDNWISEGIKAMQQTNASIVGGKVVFTFSPKKRAAEYYDAISNMQIKENVETRGVGKTANLFVKKKVFDTIGIFPQNIKSGGDVLFTMKATQSGFKLVYAPDACVYHPTRSFSQLIIKTFRVAVGKANIKKMSGDSLQKKSVKLVQSGSIWSLISPWHLKRKMISSGYRVGFLKFISILLVAYNILFVGLLGVLYGKYGKSKTDKK